MLAHAYLGPGDEAIFTRHGFLLYSIVILANGATPVDVPDKRYGKVKAWPAAAWAICHDVDLLALFGAEVA